MYLWEVIRELSKLPPGLVLENGIRNPHSYRGNYSDLAFEPSGPQLAAEALQIAQSTVNTIFTGWKGGEFKMTEWSECYLAYQGNTGEEIRFTARQLQIGTGFY